MVGLSRGEERAASHCCSSVLHDDRVEKGRLTLVNLELDFRRHVYGGDVGQRIELGQQHSLIISTTGQRRCVGFFVFFL